MSRKAVDTRSRTKLGTRTMRIRLLFVFGAIVLICIGLTVRIVLLNKNKGDAYQKKVLAQQSYVSNVIQYKRGDIVDCHGNKLATSKKVYNLILDPKAILEENKYIQPTKDALKMVFGIAEDTVEAILKESPNSRYYQMKEYKALDSDYVERLEKLQEENENIKGVWFEEEYKREYPYSTVACDVIGFCSETNTGAWGIENQYNEELNGTYGRRYGYYDSELNLVQTVKAATNGYTIKSTIDVNVQGIMEQHIEKFMHEIGAKNVGCVIMNPNNGGIIAMGSDPVYDLNNPRDLSKSYSKEELAKMSDEDQLIALNELWRNYCISDSYEPGSTFKPMTIAACLDEGIAKNSTSFVCDGGQQVADHYIKCVAYRNGGHGNINLCQSLMVSCNDAMMQLGASLGKTKFLDYVNRFGFGRKTGIDLPGEATGTIFNSETMHETELATSTFGQSQTVTMVQMAAAFSAIVNGGNYYQPHVVQEICSESGAVVQSNDNVLESKVVTEDTSKLLRKYLLKTVKEGTASPAQVKGYQVGGKTGTAEKAPRGQGNYLVSFLGCVPAKNPEIVIYVVIDEPNVEDQAHSTYATEFASDLLEDILPLLEIYPTGKTTSADSEADSGDGENKKGITLPSTVNGNSILEAPEGGYVDGDYGVAQTDADETKENTGLETEAANTGRTSSDEGSDEDGEDEPEETDTPDDTQDDGMARGNADIVE